MAILQIDIVFPTHFNSKSYTVNILGDNCDTYRINLALRSGIICSDIMILNFYVLKWVIPVRTIAYGYFMSR